MLLGAIYLLRNKQTACNVTHFTPYLVKTAHTMQSWRQETHTGRVVIPKACATQIMKMSALYLQLKLWTRCVSRSSSKEIKQ